MENKYLTPIEINTYLKIYKIQTGLPEMNYLQDFNLDKYIYNVQSNLLYGDNEITVNDIDFIEENNTEQTKEYIVNALNKFRLKVI